MAIINTYPTATPKGADLLIGTQVKDGTIEENSTKSFTVDALGSYIVTSTSGITGSGTLNTIAMFTPNGQAIGNSVITQSYDFINYTIDINGILEVGETTIADGSIDTALLLVNNITAGNAGNVGLYGGVIIGNEATDILQISSSVSDYTGTASTAAGQILVSNASSQLEWDDATDIVSGAVAKLIPFTITASAGGSSAYNADNNIVEIGWTGGNGTYTLFLPTATGDNQYRNIRFVTNSTFPNGASDKVEITALPGETIDGAQFFEISKVYEGVSVWSNGTEWIVIQAKAH